MRTHLIPQVHDREVAYRATEHSPYATLDGYTGPIIEYKTAGDLDFCPSFQIPGDIAREILRLATRDLEHELFAAELISRLGLDREAINREGLEVGNEILKAIDGFVGTVQSYRRVADKAENQLKAINDLLNQEDPEILEDLAKHLRENKDGDVLWPSFAGQARIAWRWFRKQMK